MSGSSDEMREWTVHNPDELGEVIAYFRKDSGLTQADLAERLGVHRSYLSAIERGHTTEHLQAVFRALRRLGLQIVVRPGPGGP